MTVEKRKYTFVVLPITTSTVKSPLTIAPFRVVVKNAESALFFFADITSKSAKRESADVIMHTMSKSGIKRDRAGADGIESSVRRVFLMNADGMQNEEV